MLASDKRSFCLVLYEAHTPGYKNAPSYTCPGPQKTISWQKLVDERLRYFVGRFTVSLLPTRLATALGLQVSVA